MRTETPQLSIDPNAEQLKVDAFNQNVNAVRTEVQGDTAAIMARYGTRLAMAGAANSQTPALSAGMATLTGKP